MRLTPEGSRLVRHAERMIAAWRMARQDVATDGQQLVVGGSHRLWDVMLQPWIHRIKEANPNLAMIAESQTPEILTRRLIDGATDIAIMLEPAQLDILHVQEICPIDFVLVSTQPDVPVDVALADNYLYVDWGLSFALDHRRRFPDAREDATRMSHAVSYPHLTLPTLLRLWRPAGVGPSPQLNTH